jgi:heat shock protein HtpX
MAAQRGLISQIRRNNQLSALILIGFPTLLVVALYTILYFGFRNTEFDVLSMFFRFLPIVLGGAALWLVIAFFAHSKMIQYASGAKSLGRKENKRVYNLVENLCISQGMKMPNLYIIESGGLNAFASGINERTFSVTLTRGIIDALDDDELEGVIAHELMHIQNRDVRLLIISIIFVGIFSFLVDILFRSLLHGAGRKRDRDNDSGGGNLVLIAMLVTAVAYLLSVLFKFALSRKREYMADAGAAEMTRKPWALANALRKISGKSEVSSMHSDEVKQLFIHNLEIGSLFKTHPPIEKRISFLEQVG